MHRPNKDWQRTGVAGTGAGAGDWGQGADRTKIGHGRVVVGTVAGAGGRGNGYADTKISEPAFTSDSCVCVRVCVCVSALWPSGAAVCLFIFRFCYFFVIFVLATKLMFTMRLQDRLSNFGFSLEQAAEGYEESQFRPSQGALGCPFSFGDQLSVRGGCSEFGNGGPYALCFPWVRLGGRARHGGVISATTAATAAAATATTAATTDRPATPTTTATAAAAAATATTATTTAFRIRLVRSPQEAADGFEGRAG